MPLFAADDLTRFGAAVLTAAGAFAGEAHIVAASLVDANLCGHDSHGIVRLPSYVALLHQGHVSPGAELEILRETPAVVHCDAHLGFGQVQARRLTELTIAKARTVGMASGTARDCGHVGRLGEYTEYAARQGLAALLAVNDNGVLRTVAPPGGLEARISTNPLSIAVPTDGEPLVFDASTSAVAQGKVMVRRADNVPCPDGWLQDAAGQPSNDPHTLQAEPPGTLLPLGGPVAYKGFGLGVLLDLLCGGLSGGFCPPPRPQAHNCNTVLLAVWDPEWFSGRAHLQQQAAELIASIRGCPRKPGVDRIDLPGDGSRQTRTERSRHGIPVRDGVWQSLVEVARSLGVEAAKPASA